MKKWLEELICEHCGAVYRLPDLTDEAFGFETMRVVSDPFPAGGQVWFWSEKEKVLYLNLSCKDALDALFLRSGQSISGSGTVRKMDVHVRWRCEACGELSEINKSMPCLINDQTQIKLMNVS